MGQTLVAAGLRTAYVLRTERTQQKELQRVFIPSLERYRDYWTALKPFKNALETVALLTEGIRTLEAKNAVAYLS